MNISERSKNIIDNCRFCWMCRHVCPIGNATGQERNTARARALAASLVVRGAEKAEDVAENLYECALCGACTNNCVTGWDPKVFITELRTGAALDGLLPAPISRLVSVYAEKGNVFGADFPEQLRPLVNTDGDVLFLAGQNAVYRSPESVENALALLKKAGVKAAFSEEGNDTGAALWFLVGNTAETVAAARRAADVMNRYRKVIVYDPVDLRLIRHEYAEWGMKINAEVVGFQSEALALAESGALPVKKSRRVYTVQDSYALARDLDDVTTVRKIVDRIGANRDMLLCGKEANFAGSLVMNEYMPDVMKKTAEMRWADAKNSGCVTLVTSDPSEYVLLKATAPEVCRVVSVEEAILENLRA